MSTAAATGDRPKRVLLGALVDETQREFLEPDAASERTTLTKGTSDQRHPGQVSPQEWANEYALRQAAGDTDEHR